MPINNIKKRFEDLRLLGKLKAEELDYLINIEKVSFAELKVDNKKFPAWRIVSNRALGPGKGGIRFHSGLEEEELKALAIIMTLKNSLLELPFGGAKGGIKFNSKDYDQKFLEKISRAYIDSFYQVLGENQDIPAPDLYTNAQNMSWMLDQYEKKTSKTETAMITGKPKELGGLSLRDTSAARGAYVIIEQISKILNFKKEGSTVAIQGFGNLGSNLAKMLFIDNFKIVAVSDSQGGIFRESGLDIDELLEFKKDYGRISVYSDNKAISNDELLGLEVDILILGALENQIRADNVDKIKAKQIIEIANAPITYEADRVLFANNITVWPDILVNSGGVLASYFEWSQNKSGGLWEEQQLEDLLDKKMIRIFNNVYNKYLDLEKKIDLRSSAYLLAIERIIKAGRLRGQL